MASRFQEPSASLNDPNQASAFRSFWTAPGGPSRPQEGMYEYNPSYQQQQQPTAAAVGGDHGHSHGPDDGGHGHSHGPHGHGHHHEEKEDTPLLSSSSSAAERGDRRIFGLFSSYMSLCYCLIPLLLALLLLGLLYGYSSSQPASPPLIITGSSPSASSVAAFCNPFALFPSSVDLLHHHGLVALLYLLPSSLTSSATSSSYYLQHAVSGNSTFFFSALDTPTRVFTRVFQARNLSSGEELLLPSQFFLLSFHTVLLPSRPSESAPFDPTLPVQFALISDDGASLFGSEVLETQSSPSSSSLLIDNDGVHTTRIAFSSPAVNLSSPLNLTLRYFQGPPAHIALQLLYRQQSAAAADGDEYEEEEEEDEGEDEEQLQIFPAGRGDKEGNDLYWFAGSEGSMSTPTRRYQQLTDAGWRVVPAAWYWLPARYQGKEDIDRKLAAGIDPCL